MAKAPSLAENLKKQLECAVCLEKYTEPRVLPCLHSFCKRCLQGLLTQEGAIRKINCPTCRLSAEIPQGQIDMLPVSFFVNNLLSMVALHEDFESGNLKCDNCVGGDLPTNRCTTCSHFLCEFCTQAHQRGRNTQSHSLISLQEAKKMGSLCVTKPSFCNEHEGEVLKLFCMTCEEAICRDCTIVKHRGHEYTFVKDAFSKRKESLLKILSETKTKASTLKKGLTNVSEKKRSVNLCADQTVQEVIKRFRHLTACLDVRRGELICKIEEFRKGKLKSLEVQEEELETALGSVQSSVEFTEGAFENGSEVEILNMCKQMSSRLQNLNSAKWQLEPCTGEGLKFKPVNQQRNGGRTFSEATGLPKGYDQLKHNIATFGVVTDVVTCASMSTVTMGNGQEGVMYNTLCGQPVEFIITAKEWNGRRRTEGGDVLQVNSQLIKGSYSGSGTYRICYNLQQDVQSVQYLLPVKLNGCHVQGSPFTWCNVKWNLLSMPFCYDSGHQIQFSCENLTAELETFLPPNLSYEYGEDVTAQFITPFQNLSFGFDPGRMYTHQHPTTSEIHDSGGRLWTFFPIVSQHPGTGEGPWVVGSFEFVTGRHSWKVRMYGNVLQDFSFGVCSNRLHSTPGQPRKWWVWNSMQVYKVLHQNSSQVIARTGSTITDCASGDIIEFYLDCENGTLMMCNPRTKQSDTLDGVERYVVPVFCMTTNGDKVSLLISN